MSKNKVYAVRNGRTKGFFDSWEECQRSITGYPGAEFRGFVTMQDAEAWYYGGGASVRGAGEKIPPLVVVPAPVGDIACNVYTDGSYRDGAVSFGVLVEGRGRQYKFYGTVDAGEYATSRNEAAELLGVLVAVQVAYDLGFVDVRVVHDYTGVSGYFLGSWTARTGIAVAYCDGLRRFIQETGLRLEFQQVRGHSGLPGNVVADKLAARAGNLREMVSLQEILGGTLSVGSVPLCTAF